MMYSQQGGAAQQDISYLMKERAKRGYGIPALLKDEKKLAEVLQVTRLVVIKEYSLCYKRNVNSHLTPTPNTCFECFNWSKLSFGQFRQL